MIECMLFDSDGTLVDSEPLSFVIIADMFASRGLLMNADEAHMRFRGWKMGEVLQVLAEEHRTVLGEDFLAEFRAIQLERLETDLRPIPGVTQVLPRIALPKAVVTSGPMAKVRKALSVTGMDHYFGDNIYSAYEVGVWKPDPEIYRIAARDMGYDVERCMIVEDSPIGLQAAANSGAVTVFLNRFGDRVEYGNVTEIESMHELPGLLGIK